AQIDCDKECNRRCSKAYCGICCEKCHCVPPGT
uniref:Cypmaclein (Fragments) n=1 Tax=Cupressus sempervirens TaxID=13469 RepID=CMLN_CUPSE|nr:RecName: Full=Cypmaclein; AltName: Allergen=Cup s 7 [Cupressus sempervirens]